jgi:hypothetical protein
MNNRYRQGMNPHMNGYRGGNGGGNYGGGNYGGGNYGGGNYGGNGGMGRQSMEEVLDNVWFDGVLERVI